MNHGKNGGAQETLANFREFAKESLGKADAGLLELSNPQNWPRMPGISRIPVCDFGTWVANHRNWGNSARKNLYKDPPCPEYPCCPFEVLYKIPKGDMDHELGA
jgi:hypothetical protein